MRRSVILRMAEYEKYIKIKNNSSFLKIITDKVEESEKKRREVAWIRRKREQKEKKEKEEDKRRKNEEDYCATKNNRIRGKKIIKEDVKEV